MHQVITKVALVPGRLGNIKAFFESTLVDVLSEFSSWRGASLAVDPDTNEIVVVGSWADAEEMRSWLADSRHSDLMGQLAESFAGLPAVTIAEVVTEVVPHDTR